MFTEAEKRELRRHSQIIHAYRETLALRQESHKLALDRLWSDLHPLQGSRPRTGEETVRDRGRLEDVAREMTEFSWGYAEKHRPRVQPFLTTNDLVSWIDERCETRAGAELYRAWAADNSDFVGPATATITTPTDEARNLYGEVRRRALEFRHIVPRLVEMLPEPETVPDPMEAVARVRALFAPIKYEPPAAEHAAVAMAPEGIEPPAPIEPEAAEPPDPPTPETPAETAGEPEPPPIILNGPRNEVILFGKNKSRLARAQYDVLQSLVDAHADGRRLSIDELRSRSKVEDPVGALKRLRCQDDDWAAFIDMARKPGVGYGLNDRPPTST